MRLKKIFEAADIVPIGTKPAVKPTEPAKRETADDIRARIAAGKTDHTAAPEKKAEDPHARVSARMHDVEARIHYGHARVHHHRREMPQSEWHMKTGAMHEDLANRYREGEPE